MENPTNPRGPGAQAAQSGNPASGTGHATQESGQGMPERREVAEGTPLENPAVGAGHVVNPLHQAPSGTMSLSGVPLMSREEAMQAPKGPGAAAPGSPGAPSGPANMPIGDPMGRKPPEQQSGPNQPNRGSLAGANNPVENHPDIDKAGEHFRRALDVAHKPRASALNPCEMWAEIRDEVGEGVDALQAAVRLPMLGKLAPAVRMLSLFEGMVDSLCQGKGGGGNAPS